MKPKHDTLTYRNNIRTRLSIFLKERCDEHFSLEGLQEGLFQKFGKAYNLMRIRQALRYDANSEAPQYDELEKTWKIEERRWKWKEPVVVTERNTFKAKAESLEIDNEEIVQQLKANSDLIARMEARQAAMKNLFDSGIKLLSHPDAGK